MVFFTGIKTAITFNYSLDNGPKKNRDLYHSLQEGQHVLLYLVTLQTKQVNYKKNINILIIIVLFLVWQLSNVTIYSSLFFSEYNWEDISKVSHQDLWENARHTLMN